MFLRSITRKKNGKDHRYFSIVENKRLADGRVVQRHVLYLGEINSSQESAWRKSIEVFEEGKEEPSSLSLFPEDQGGVEVSNVPAVRVRLSELRLCRPRQWGACWLVVKLWQELELDRFWGERLEKSRKGTHWDEVLLVLVAYRLIAPGSEWRLHRQWFGQSALGDLLSADASLADPHKLYDCHDLLLEHKQALFDHLTGRWRDLFNLTFEVLLYDLTSTYFESDPPEDDNDKRRFGYSRDKRKDCVQVVIALVVTPQGFPLAYEVMAGNTKDSSTLQEFLDKIEKQYGKAQRIWLMDRGIPTEKVLAQMRQSDPPVKYLVGTPKGRLTSLEKALLDKPWQQARPGVEVKLLNQADELYVLAQSADRVRKERSMRRRQLKKLWARLKKLSTMKKLEREELLMKLGAAKQQSPSAYRLVQVEVDKDNAAFTYRLDKEKLRRQRRREGRYLLRTNLTETDPAKLWSLYLQLVNVEEAFKNLKGDLAIRPIFHQSEKRIEAHVLISFLAYCLHITLTERLRALAPGLTARSALEKFASMQMIDVHVPTTDGREIVMSRTTQPAPELQLLLDKLKLQLPAQPPPRITSAQLASVSGVRLHCSDFIVSASRQSMLTTR
jgi:transposase